MFSKRSTVFPIYVLIDAILIFASFYIAYIIRFSNFTSMHLLNPSTWGSFEVIEKSDFLEYSTVFLFWMLFIIISLHIIGLHRTDRELNIPTETYRTLKAIFIASIPVAAAIFFLQFKFFSRGIFLGSLLAVSFSLTFWRVIKRLIVRHLITKGYNSQNLLIVGAGRIGIALTEEIGRHPYLGFRIIGFLDDVATEMVKNKYKIVGKISEIKKVIQENFIDEIFVTIPSQKEIVSQLLWACKSLGRNVRVVPENFEFPWQRMETHFLGSIPLIDYHLAEPLRGQIAIKRVFDLLICIPVFLISLPFFVFISLLIKLDNTGPVFYISKRTGRRGKIFDFYKFRSMVRDADLIKKELMSHNEVVDGPIFKIKNDPRVTRVGRLLRKYSLDEAPQLINVIKGDMSLVGPRPFPVDESNGLKYWQMARLDVKPGITGLSQIRGRSDLSFSRWVKWDQWYLNHWSLGLDIWILWNTLPVVFKGKGAY